MSDDKPTPQGEGSDATPPPTDDEKARKIAEAKAAVAAKKAAEADAEPKPPWELKPEPPQHQDGAGAEDVKALSEGVEGSVLAADEYAGAVTVTIPSDKVLEVCRFLKEERGYAFLVDLTAVDWPEREGGRFDVVYWLHRFEDSERLRLIAAVAEDASLASVTGVWRTANWMEREAYDMFGILFDGHPGLERIMMWEGFNGHPLRKDFPVEGIDTGAAIYPDTYPADGGPVVEEEGGE